KDTSMHSSWYAHRWFGKVFMSNYQSRRTLCHRKKHVFQGCSSVHCRHAANLPERTERLFLSAVQYQNLVAKGFDQHQQMGGKQKGCPCRRAPPDGLFDVADAARVQAGEGFV